MPEKSNLSADELLVGIYLATSDHNRFMDCFNGPFTRYKHKLVDRPTSHKRVPLAISLTSEREEPEAGPSTEARLDDGKHTQTSVLSSHRPDSINIPRRSPINSPMTMFASRSAESITQAHPVRMKSMSLLAKLLAPKPRMQLDGPQTAYIRRKARSRPVRLNAVQIVNERRSKAAKEQGSIAPSTVEDDEVFQWPAVVSNQAGGPASTGTGSSRRQRLYEESRHPTSYIPWPTSA
ncbi:hypothetical protein BDV93DRAFT_508606 [Ceratobasidium sp. AG-I]|nr:hypothetical protein BDV93DRAFT_508606 [Ceratobasidium sp. AG-I]